VGYKLEGWGKTRLIKEFQLATQGPARLLSGRSRSYSIQGILITASLFQWVPFLLVLQAVSYLLPELFWTTFSGLSGFHVGTLLEKAHKNTINKDNKNKSK